MFVILVASLIITYLLLTTFLLYIYNKDYISNIRGDIQLVPMSQATLWTISHVILTHHKQ